MSFDDLVSAAFDRPLTPEERAELNRKIVEDPGCAERFSVLARVHADLWNLHGLKSSSVPTKRRRIPFQQRSSALPWVWAAAAAIVAALAFYRAAAAPAKPLVQPSAAVPRPMPEPPPDPAPEAKEPPKAPVPAPAEVPPKPREEPKFEVPAPLPAPEPPKPQPAAPPPPPPPPVTRVALARVGKVSGMVLCIGAERNVRATEGMELSEGQGLETQAGASAAIVFPDKTRVEVEASSRIEGLQPGRLVVKNGTISAEISAQPAGKPLLFVSPQAEAEILGTTLRIAVDPRSTRLEVSEGKVRFTRSQDRKSIEVAGGFYAVAGAGIELKATPLSKVVSLLSLSFEDGKSSAAWVGKLAAGPARTANRGCLEGQLFPNERITRVKVAETDGLFSFRKGADLSFDYWADGDTAILSVYLWNRTQSLSMGGYEIKPLARRQWTRVTVALSDLRDGDKRLQEGDIVANLTIQSNQGSGVLFVDNVDVAVPRRK